MQLQNHPCASLRKQHLPPWCIKNFYPLKINVTLENTQLSLYIGAWVAATKDPELMQYYRERKGADHKKLIIKMASKTLGRMYSVIKRGEPFKLKEAVVI